MRTYANTNIGLTRLSNQDSYSVIFNDENELLAMVCDGIGGAMSGDVASKMCVDTLSSMFKTKGSFKNEEELFKWLVDSINIVNKQIYIRSKIDSNCQGMGTTLVALIICKFGQYVVNIGDSRCYIHDEKDHFKCITTDHNVYNDLIRFNHVDEKEAASNTQRNYLTRAVGIIETVEVEIFKVSENVKTYLLCSDGLHGYIDEAIFSMIIKEKNSSLKEKNDTLIDLSLKVGGYDNVTVVLVELGGETCE